MYVYDVYVVCVTCFAQTDLYVYVCDQSKVYYEQQQEQNATPQVGRNRVDPEKLFTVANFLRMFACIIMRGLVLTADDPTFFNGEKHGDKYTRSGATAVTGLGINDYQQLLRYMHMADNSKRPPVDSDEFDQCYHLRTFITFLQEAFVKWFIPGKDNAVDEAGLPSRFRWLRMYNKDKPNKYFIEVLMACCSITRFCWGFFINEKSEKRVLRQNRRLPRGRTTGRGQRQSKYDKVPYFQTEFDERTRMLQSQVGATTAHIYHFAKMLRSFDNAPGHDRVVTYRLFMDRRWDSLYGHYLAMSEFGVSCTTTVAKGSRFHVANDDNFPSLKGDTKNLKKRGKYRSAYATVDGITFRTCLWADSKLIATVSADLGTEEKVCYRRVGRHEKPIACPNMVFVRGKWFRAVDQNDQMRLNKWHFEFVTRKKPWQKAVFGLTELLLINIYIISSFVSKELTTHGFRWALLLQMVQRAEELEAAATATTAIASPARQVEVPTQYSSVGRWHPDSVTLHHHDDCPDYVTPEQAIINQTIMDEDPAVRISNKKPRERDKKRADNKVRNPMFTGGALCVVCRYHCDEDRGYPRLRRTNKYCRECSTDPH